MGSTNRHSEALYSPCLNPDDPGSLEVNSANSEVNKVKTANPEINKVNPVNSEVDKVNQGTSEINKVNTNPEVNRININDERTSLMNHREPSVGSDYSGSGSRLLDRSPVEPMDRMAGCDEPLFGAAVNRNDTSLGENQNEPLLRGDDLTGVVIDGENQDSDTPLPCLGPRSQANSLRYRNSIDSEPSLYESANSIARPDEHCADADQEAMDVGFGSTKSISNHSDTNNAGRRSIYDADGSPHQHQQQDQHQQRQQQDQEQHQPHQQEQQHDQQQQHQQQRQQQHHQDKQQQQQQQQQQRNPRVRGSILKHKHKPRASVQLPDDIRDSANDNDNGLESAGNDTPSPPPREYGNSHRNSRHSVFGRLHQHRPSLFSLPPPRRRQPCSLHCCHRTVQWPQLLTWSKCCEQKIDDSEEEGIEDEPFVKRCSRMFFTFVYCLLASIAVFVTYAMIQDLITSMQYPVRSIRYTKVTEYEAPGIAVYGGGARFLACGYYYNNVVLSKVRVSQLDVENLTCNFTQLTYTDPHYPDVERHVTIMRGPISFVRREAIFLHFDLNDATRDFFTVSYFVFPGYDEFVKLNSTEQGERMVEYHRYSPTFALSAGLRMWIKLSMFESHLMDGVKHTEFSVEYSVVRYHDTRPLGERDNHLFFIFFEWKNDIIEQSYLIYSTTPWSVGAGLCGMFLMLHKGYQLSHTTYTRLQKDKERREQRRRTLRERRQSRAVGGTLRGRGEGEGEGVMT